MFFFRNTNLTDTNVAMAIHADYPGLKMEIIFGDEVLKEYEDDEGIPEPNTVERSVESYVEAQASTDFGIRFSFSSSFPDDRDVRLDLFTDDDIVDTQVARKKELYKGYSHTVAAISRYLDGDFVKQRLRFRDLNISKCPFPIQASLMRAWY